MQIRHTRTEELRDLETRYFFFVICRKKKKEKRKEYCGMNSVLGDLWRCVDWKMHGCDCQKRVLAITPLEKRKRRGNPEGTAYVSSALPVIAFL